MFSGIIKQTSPITSREKIPGGLQLTIKKPKFRLGVGDSIAVNGVCLTVSKLVKNSFVVELMPETLSKTTFGQVVPKTVDLEPSLKLSDRAHGHFVTGHVDVVGAITQVKNQGSATILTITFPKQFKKLVAPKGSIAIDGVSLTIVDATATTVTVSLVNYTIKNTTLGMVKKNDIVNIEFDILAKYAASN